MLTYLQPGDPYQKNDIYEHYRHNIASPRVVGVSLEDNPDHGTSTKPGDIVTQEHADLFKPRRWSPDPITPEESSP